MRWTVGHGSAFRETAGPLRATEYLVPISATRLCSVKSSKKMPPLCNNGGISGFSWLGGQNKEPICQQHENDTTNQSNIGQVPGFFLTHIAIFQSDVFKRASWKFAAILQVMPIAEHRNDQSRISRAHRWHVRARAWPALRRDDSSLRGRASLCRHRIAPWRIR